MPAFAVETRKVDDRRRPPDNAAERSMIGVGGRALPPKADDRRVPPTLPLTGKWAALIAADTAVNQRMHDGKCRILPSKGE